MGHKKTKKDFRRSTRSNVEQEMGKPRMSRSAKIAELDSDTERLREEPSTSMTGTVHKIISSQRASKPEKAQISVDAADKQYRDLRIENKLTNEHGDDVKLKKGAHVDVTITAHRERPRN
jgi:hypothetical protein